MKHSFIFAATILLSLVMSTNVLATSELIPNKLVLHTDDNLGIIYTHELQKNQTIYGLSRFFNTDMQKITIANPGVKLDAIKLNQTVNIPINTRMISSERNLSPSKSYIPVFYTVKAKDNLFRIAKVYFDQSIENVMNINKLKSMELSIDQKLLVGWYEYNPEYKEKLAWTQKGIEVDAKVATQNTVPQQTIAQQRQAAQTAVPKDEKLVFQKVVSERKTNLPAIQHEEKLETIQNVDIQNNVTNTTLDHAIKPVESTDIVTSEKTETEHEEVVVSTTNELILSPDPFENRNGIYIGEYTGKPDIKSDKLSAQWNANSKDKVNLFALHSTAKTNSYIEIYNPMLDRKVIAKVVGNIPPKAYKKNVELIISPKVAETLGAKDKKFFVKVRFIE